MKDAQVLIVGAGPTGLMLALWLAKKGVPFRIIERNGGPGEASRAVAVQARTLEFSRQLGIADEVVASGIVMDRLRLWEGEHEVANVQLGNLGEGLSPYPFTLSFPQDDHERLLAEKLKTLGVEIEWDTELVGFSQDEQKVAATLRHDEVEETIEAAYLCGCDGAHSTVRHSLGIGFPGGTYEQLFYVADAKVSGRAAQPHDVTVCLGEENFGLCLPVRSTETHRLIGSVPIAAMGKESIDFEDVRPSVEPLLGLKVDEVNWFATYRVHHRVADRFQGGRAFILGDAGHIHSPAGGQGMNTGIGDAVNLAWKLADVLQNGAKPAILATYEIERIAFAHQLVATTDRIFRTATGRNPLSRFARTFLVPSLLPLAFRITGIRRTMFDIVSQTRIDYRHSPLSEGEGGFVHGGDRLPWVGDRGRDNFKPLASLDWQIHVYGEAKASLREEASKLGIRLCEFDWCAAMAPEDVACHVAYLVRPDGYVAVADPDQDPERLRGFFRKWHPA
ncbi:FAD-dependent monooxygenase [soil metagenome]